MHDEHGVSDLVFAGAAAEDDHAHLAHAVHLLVERAYVVHDVEPEPRALERVEAEHIADGAVHERGAVHGDAFLAQQTSIVGSGAKGLVQRGAQRRRGIHFVRPVVDRALVVDLLAQAVDERAG